MALYDNVPDIHKVAKKARTKKKQVDKQGLSKTTQQKRTKPASK